MKRILSLTIILTIFATSAWSNKQYSRTEFMLNDTDSLYVVTLKADTENNTPKMGAVKPNGKQLIVPIYDYIERFNNNLLKARLGDKTS